MIHPQF